jgi:hypothetical protein
VRTSGVGHRFRTTLDPDLLRDEQIAGLRRLVLEGWGSGYDIRHAAPL